MLKPAVSNIQASVQRVCGGLLLGLALLTLGCSSHPNRKPLPVWTLEQQAQYAQAQRAVPRVIVQVCLRAGPAKVSLTAVAGPPIRSLDTGRLLPAGTTAAGEPVFEGYSNEPSKHEADVVRLDSAPDLQHVFTLEGRPPGKDWSAWGAPQGVSSDPELLWRVVHGGPLDKLAPQPDPKLLARYRVMSFGEYLDRVGGRRLGTFTEDFAPGCSLP